jgi:streptogrisin C
MIRTNAARLAGVAMLAAGAAIALSVPAIAGPAALNAASPANTESYPAELLQAVQRDLGLNADQARTRLATDAKSGEIENKARDAVGAAFAGAWIDSTTGKVTVGVTDGAKADAVRSAGADARVVRFSQQQLAGTKSVLDDLKAPASITGWRVDDATNTVVVEVNRTQRDAAAEAFLATARGLSEAVRVDEVTETPRPLYNVRGGDAWYIGTSGRCSVGFSATDSGGGKHFVTAGHCTTGTGTTANGYNRVAMGRINGSTFGSGGDYGKVDVTSASWALVGTVNHYGGSDVAVRGSSETAVGGAICRSGSTTGWHCGTVQAKNQTVNYPQASVRGLTRTNVCAEPGDSGGSWITGNQAQGVTSGGSGNCSSGGTTYFQPVNKALTAYGLRLVLG